MSLAEVGRDDARHVLWHFGHPEGLQPGSFTRCLLSAATHADPGNRQRLELAFPGLMTAVDFATRRVGGIDALVRVARGE